MRRTGSHSRPPPAGTPAATGWARCRERSARLVLGLKALGDASTFSCRGRSGGDSRRGAAPPLAITSPRPKTPPPAPLPPPPHPPHRERGRGWSVFAFLPLLPVRGRRRGREKRAGVIRGLGVGARSGALIPMVPTIFPAPPPSASVPCALRHRRART